MSLIIVSNKLILQRNNNRTAVVIPLISAFLISCTGGDGSGLPPRLPPEAVAEKIRHALESPRPKIRYRVTLPAYFGSWAARWVPAALIDRLMVQHVKKRFG